MSLKKKMFVFSNGSYFYKSVPNYTTQNNFLFYEKDSISLNKKKSNKKTKLELIINSKSKYFNH